MTMPYACTRCMMPTEEAVCPVCGAKTENARRIRDALPPQTILHGQYLLGAALGGGGFGTTYRALKLESVDPVRGEMVAVKEYFPHSIAARSDDGRAVPQRNDAKLFTNWRDKFVTEYNMLLEASRCPSVVQVLDLFEENNTAYLVMAYVEGETLAHRVREQGAIPPEELMRMMKPFIENLRMLHEKKIIHRDIKPANIILKGGDTPILLDFGSARPNDPDSRKTILISKGYAPPEQYEENSLQGNWTDVYGLCATMYFALTAQEPADALERKYAIKVKGSDPACAHPEAVPEAEKPVGGCADGGACDGVRRAPVVLHEAGNGALQRKQAGCAEARAHHRQRADDARPACRQARRESAQALCAAEVRGHPARNRPHQPVEQHRAAGREPPAAFAGQRRYLPPADQWLPQSLILLCRRKPSCTPTICWATRSAAARSASPTAPCSWMPPRAAGWSP